MFTQLRHAVILKLVTRSVELRIKGESGHFFYALIAFHFGILIGSLQLALLLRFQFGPSSAAAIALCAM